MKEQPELNWTVPADDIYKTKRHQVLPGARRSDASFYSNHHYGQHLRFSENSHSRPNHPIYVQGTSTLKDNSSHIHILTSSRTRNNTELLITLYSVLHHKLPMIKLHLLPNQLDDPNIRTNDLNHHPANRILNIRAPAMSPNTPGQ